MLKKLYNHLHGAGFLIAAVTASNFINFVFNAFLGRTLTLEQFSIVTLANTLWFIITIFLNSLASTVNNRTAYLSTKKGTEIARGFRAFFMRKSLPISFMLTFLWLLLIPVFSFIFHTHNYLLFLTITPAILFGLFSSINKGYFQGSLFFVKAGLIILVEALCKLFFAFVFILLNLPKYAYLAIPLSVFCSFLLTCFFIFDSKVQKPHYYHHKYPKRLLFATFLTIFSSVAFLSVDLLLARHFLSSAQSGAYALLSLIGKMVFFFGSTINVLILTLASRDTGLKKNSLINFYRILSVNIGLLFISFLSLGIFGNTFVPFLFGEKSRVILGFLISYTVGISFFTIANAFASYHLAKHQFVFAYNGIIATILLIIGITIWHKNITDFVSVITFSSYAYLALNTICHVFHKDASDYIDDEDSQKFGEYEKIKTDPLSVSIGLPAYNEEKNIGKLLESLLHQETQLIRINKIMVISSGSTDRTDVIVEKIAQANPNVILIKEKERRGKASAINIFLKNANDPVVVLQSTDTVAVKDTIEKLCRPFIIDKNLGMTGGAPHPINDPNTFLGYIIQSWWWFHRHIPRFGEIIAFRNVLDGISETTAVDEAYIQAKLIQFDYKIMNVDEAVVLNKGPETITDLLKQRRRIFAGHAKLQKEEEVKIDNMTKSSIRLLLFTYKLKNIKQLFWFMGGIFIEIYARILGIYDTRFKKLNPYIWDTAKTTKNIDMRNKLRKRYDLVS